MGVTECILSCIQRLKVGSNIKANWFSDHQKCSCQCQVNGKMVNNMGKALCSAS